MNNQFFISSKKIANDFLQSIVFIDDRAYVNNETPNNHDFDAFQITKSFAKSQKVCAVYKPESESEIGDMANLAKKADVVVVDWQIRLKNEDTKSGDTELEEEDVEYDDPRGPYTKKIIREVLTDHETGQDCLKLILVYTGEIDLPGITDEIHKELEEIGISNIIGGLCSVSTENVKILVRAKPSINAEEEETKFKHNPELAKRIVKYEELPEFILDEFTKMTSGLLSNFILRSLSILRSNTFRLIRLYNKELDPSFLSHRLLLPNQEDSKEQLIEMLSHSIESLLNYYETGEAASIERIKEWIDSHEFNHSILITKGKEINVNVEFIKTWAEIGFIRACEKAWEEADYGEIDSSIRNKFEDKFKSVYKIGSTLFQLNNENENIDSMFSILTHHKSNLKQKSKTPKISLGTIIKEAKEGQIDKYFLCIQAKCDSVRITNVRRFIFLRLEPVSGEKKFDFVIEDQGTYIRLKLIKDIFELRTIKFMPDSDKQIVIATKRDEQFIFKAFWGEEYLWIADLKDAHAQRVANIFSAQLSRVGLDESEWLRRWASL